MTNAFKISILLNAVLAGGIIFIWSEHPQPHPVAPSVQPVAPTSIPASPVASVPPAQPASFHWKQLDAPDYHLYVKNLRAVGCPEPTVRAIVMADVHAASQQQARILKRKLDALASRSGSNEFGTQDVEAKLKARLQALPSLEAAEIADLLGLKPAPVQMAGNDSSAAGDDQGEDDQPAATMPEAFQNIDTTALGLDDDQMQAIAALQKQFVDQVGGTNQDPNDPAYLARWQQAQPGADSMLRAIMGSQTYARYQMMQLKQAQAEAASASSP